MYPKEFGVHLCLTIALSGIGSARDLDARRSPPFQVGFGSTESPVRLWLRLMSLSWTKATAAS